MAAEAKTKLQQDTHQVPKPDVLINPCFISNFCSKYNIIYNIQPAIVSDNRPEGSAVTASAIMILYNP